MRRMSMMMGLAASAGMIAALEAGQRPRDRPGLPAVEDDHADKTPRQRKRWLQRQARKKNRTNK